MFPVQESPGDRCGRGVEETMVYFSNLWKSGPGLLRPRGVMLQSQLWVREAGSASAQARSPPVIAKQSLHFLAPSGISQEAPSTAKDLGSILEVGEGTWVHKNLSNNSNLSNGQNLEGKFCRIIRFLQQVNCKCRRWERTVNSFVCRGLRDVYQTQRVAFGSWLEKNIDFLKRKHVGYESENVNTG